MRKILIGSLISISAIASETAIVANFFSEFLTEINVETNVVSNVLTLPALFVAITPDQNFAIVPNYIVNAVTRLNLIDNSNFIITNPNFKAPSGVAITPDGQYAYVTNSETPYAVFKIAIDSGEVVAMIEDSSFNAPIQIAITPDGQSAFVTNEDNDSVSRIRLSDNHVTQITNSSIRTPFGIVASHDNQFVYVANIGGGISIIDVSDNSVQSIEDPAFEEPVCVAITSDDQFLYVTNLFGQSIAKVNLGDFTVETIPFPGLLVLWMAITSDDQYAIVTCFYEELVFKMRLSDNVITNYYDAGPGAFPFGVTIGDVVSSYRAFKRPSNRR